VKNNDGETPLHKATQIWHEEIVRILLEKGADTNAKNNEDETSLHHAARYGQKAIVQLLLEKDADTTVRNKHGDTPLYLAHLSYCDVTAQLLLEQSTINRRARLNSNDSSSPGVDQSGLVQSRSSPVEVDLSFGPDQTAPTSDRTSSDLSDPGLI
jgi:ankyrin repeat protein